MYKKSNLIQDFHIFHTYNKIKSIEENVIEMQLHCKRKLKIVQLCYCTEKKADRLELNSSIHTLKQQRVHSTGLSAMSRE